ncbi:MAG: AMP-binding protein, partial [Candidatus Marinimicrobia bacterium]|nr:AMP-binding protein [Candidatus Neomarinimicrobiota bacterium]
METLTALLRNSAHDYKDNIALQFKKDGEWKGISYREMLEKVDQIGLALFAAGLERSDKVAIFSPNRPEWAIADFAIQSVTAITIPIYATNTAAQVDYILKDANCKALFVGDRQQLNVIQSVIQNNDQLKLVVLFDDLSEEIDRIVDLKQFIKLEVSDTIKEEFRKNAGLRDTADVSTIIYTSGTTGDPKGVMLSNKNFFHQFMAFEANFDIDESDKSLCFLPLSHVYERMWSYMVFKFGATNYYIEDPK